jgi:sulfite reductase alpha subunit-like flavoprotein
MVERTEEIYVLFGSQTGNSEKAAKDFCELIETKLSPSSIQKLTGSKDSVTVQPTHMQLDDFLEIDHAKWTRLVVIFVSSYGVGSAPLGAYRFRELCDAWIETESETILEGVSFALCGLGDSKFTTFFENPTAMNKALEQVGAKRVGDLGKADASGTGDHAQNKVTERWTEAIWPHIAKVVASPPLADEQLQEMQRKTVELCRKINPDFMPEPKSNNSSLVAAGGVAVVAILAYLMVQHR